MPELPEVETIKKDLSKYILHKNISAVFISPKAKINKNKKFFLDFLLDSKIKKINRIGKLFFLEFENSEIFLLIHLKMTGQLIFVCDKKMIGGGHSENKLNLNLPNKSTRIIISFIDGSKLFFNDTRRFGYFKLVNKKELETEKNKYGIEPLTKNFIFENFKTIFINKKSILKSFLLKQKNIAGLGNIYVDESCFDAGIRPDKRTNTLNENEIKKLFSSIQKIIKKACEKRGTTFNNYVDSDGNQGNYSKYLKVYGRSGKNCLKCGEKLRNIKISGRTTVFCAKCQK